MCPAPLQQNILLPRGQASARYAPAALADTILNMEVTADGTLRSVSGPTLYEPKHLTDWQPDPSAVGNVTDFGTPYAVHHAMVFGGRAEMLLLAAGGRLYAHRQRDTPWSSIALGLRDDYSAQYPPQMVTFGDYVIYADGFTRPFIVDMNYRVMPLGFTEIPSPPEFDGPTDPPNQRRHSMASASEGYSFPGDLGTPGDKLSGKDSGVLRGKWKTCLVYEDALGNRSAPSLMSEAVFFGPLRALPLRGPSVNPFTGNLESLPNQLAKDIYDLQRGAAVRLPGGAPTHAMKALIYQTGDMRNTDPTPRLAYTAHSTDGCLHGGWEDGDLGEPVRRNRPVPVFHCMVVHQGCLVVADDAMVYRSEPGFPGTFPEQNVVVADDRGRPVTALATFGDRCIAFTRSSIIDVTNMASPVVIARGPGCVGPSALAAVPGFGLVFVGESAVYRYDGAMLDVISTPIEKMLRTGINRTALSRAVMWYDPESKDIRIACAKISDPYNRLILCFRPDTGWRQLELGLHIADVAVTEGPRPLQLAAGDDFQSRGGEFTSPDVYVLDRETQVYTPNARVSLLRTVPMLFSKDMLQKGRLIHLVVQFVETYQGQSATVRVRVNYEDAYRYDSQSLRLDDVFGNGATAAQSTREVSWDTVSVGTSSVVPRRRVAVRKLSFGFDDVKRFQIELETTYPTDLEVLSLHIGYTGKADEQMRVPSAGAV